MPLCRASAGQDETDLELALRHAAREGAQEIVVLGALGGRLDHTLANVLLLTLPVLEGVSVRIADGMGETLLLRGGRAVTLRGSAGDLVSLLPLGGEPGECDQRPGLGASGGTLRFGFSRGVSNEMTSHEAHIELEQGLLVVVHGPPPGSG